MHTKYNQYILIIDQLLYYYKLLLIFQFRERNTFEFEYKIQI